MLGKFDGIHYYKSASQYVSALEVQFISFLEINTYRSNTKHKYVTQNVRASF